MNKLTFIIIMLFSLGWAQQVELQYTLTKSDDKHTLAIYAQSTSNASVDLAAINMSFLFNKGCEIVGESQSILIDSWTNFLAKEQLSTEVEITLGAQYYSRRFQWGSADPGLPQTSPVVIPPSGQPLLIMEKTLVGNCKDVYLEHVSENPVNELGDTDMKPMAYKITHPLRPELILNQGTVELYPNPANEFTSITTKDLEAGDYQVGIMDLNGKIIWEKEMFLEPEKAHKIATGSLASGAYIMRVHDALNHVNLATRLVKD